MYSFLEIGVWDSACRTWTVRLNSGVNSRDSSTTVLMVEVVVASSLISLRILPAQAKMGGIQHIGITRWQCIPSYATTGATSQDEVQSAHWYHNQVTVHPVVCYYGCDKPRWGAVSPLVSQRGDSASRRVLLRMWQAEMRGIQHIGITTRWQCIASCATTDVTSQDEVQSAHWYHNQVTVHRVVCYYGCDKPRWGAVSPLVSQPGDSASRRMLLRMWQAKMRCSQPIGITTRSQCIASYATTGATSQDEGHSAHWYHNQVTVHPVVCYYGCDKPRWGAFSTLVSQPGDSASRRMLLWMWQAKMGGIQHIGITTRWQCIPSYATTDVTSQDGGHSAHWYHNQVTVHPVVCYYGCDKPRWGAFSTFVSQPGDSASRRMLLRMWQAKMGGGGFITLVSQPGDSVSRRVLLPVWQAIAGVHACIFTVHSKCTSNGANCVRSCANQPNGYYQSDLKSAWRVVTE